VRSVGCAGTRPHQASVSIAPSVACLGQDPVKIARGHRTLPRPSHFPHDRTHGRPQTGLFHGTGKGDALVVQRRCGEGAARAAVTCWEGARSVSTATTSAGAFSTAKRTTMGERGVTDMRGIPKNVALHHLLAGITMAGSAHVPAEPSSTPAGTDGVGGA
jgi:hypothetical protein